MALKIYERTEPDSDFSVEDGNTNPIRHSIDGRTGGVIEIRYFLRNDDPDLEYSDIEISIYDPGSTKITDGTDGYSWKLKEGNEQPLSQEWDTIDPANTITMENITDSTTYLPFWLRIEVPKGASVESFDDVKLVVNATEAIS